MALLAFGFAGKVYCWQPTASPGALIDPIDAVHQAHYSFALVHVAIVLVPSKLAFASRVLSGT